MAKEFLKVVDLDTAVKTVLSTVDIIEDSEEIDITKAVGRVLAEDVYATIDVPPFDRASMDGYAVRAKDTVGATRFSPAILRITGKDVLDEFEAFEISTGEPLPKNSNSVIMYEDTERNNGELYIFKQAHPYMNVSRRGEDIKSGHIVIEKGCRLNIFDVAMLSSLGIRKVKVRRRPRVGVISTGDELIEPGEKLEHGKVYNTNTYHLSSKLLEMGCELSYVNTVKDELEDLERALREALKVSDLVIISGGTSAGARDNTYKLFRNNLLVHGISVRPGKPTIIAKADGKPVVGLSGYPGASLLLFEILVKPVLFKMMGKRMKSKRVKARIAHNWVSEKGRTEFLPVSIIDRGFLLAFPFFKGSFSLYSLLKSDGFAIIEKDVEYVREGTEVDVELFSDFLHDLVIIGSHSYAVDIIVSKMDFDVKSLSVGSSHGLMAISKGACDIAGIHLVKNGVYNIPFVRDFKNCVLIRGFNRVQGIVVKKGNPLDIRSIEDIVNKDVKFLNRNPGSGTRTLFDEELKKVAIRKKTSFEKLRKSIDGYDTSYSSHSSIGFGVKNGLGDCGISTYATSKIYGLDFIPITEEHYDFVVYKESLEKKSVRKFFETMCREDIKKEFERIGVFLSEDTGKVIV